MTDRIPEECSPERYRELVDQLYASFPSLVLPPEYTSFVEQDLTRFLIRLARYKFVARMLSPDDHVLEIGSGSGLGSTYLSQHCRRVIGIDLKETETTEARGLSRRANVEFVTGDFFTHPFPEKFDAVVALDVIEHLPVEEGSRLLEGMARLLHPHGMLVLGTPSCYSLPHQGVFSRAAHIKCYDRPELEEAVRRVCGRTLFFSMNDELVHTGHHKMAWYYFIIGFYPRPDPPAVP